MGTTIKNGSNNCPLSKASKDQEKNREQLLHLFKNRPIPDEQLLINPALYIRSSVLAKILYINELYEQIINIPGSIVELGCWWGQNLILFENLRAIYEPYNHTRKIIGFDTFEGHLAPSNQDITHTNQEDELYHQARSYYQLNTSDFEHITQLLNNHECNNVTGHIKKHTIVKGDATQTLPNYLKTYPSTIIALAYFDMALYTPTKSCLEALLPHLVKGSIIVLDELNSQETPGETIALREIFSLSKYKIKRSKYLPDRSYLTIE